MSARDRFSHSCLLSLGGIVMRGDEPMLTAWLVDHVGGDDDAWVDFAEALVALAAASVQLDALAAGMRHVLAVPNVTDATPRPKRLGMQMLVMQLNGDTAGVQGVLAAVRESDEVAELCGALWLIGHHAFTGKLVRVMP